MLSSVLGPYVIYNVAKKSLLMVKNRANGSPKEPNPVPLSRVLNWSKANGAITTRRQVRRLASRISSGKLRELDTI